jgi:hypothetical protein
LNYYNGYVVFVANNATGLGRVTNVNYVKMFRNNGVPGVFPGPAFEFNDVAFDVSLPLPSLFLRDRYGGNCFADSTLGRGMSEPKFHIQFFDPANTKTTTSATFVNFASSFWYMYHPQMRVTVLVNTPAATTYEIRLNEQGGTQQDIVTTVANTFQYYGLVVDRNNLTLNGNHNGEATLIDLEWRRASGAGTATMAFVEGLGLDLNT